MIVEKIRYDAHGNILIPDMTQFERLPYSTQSIIYGAVSSVLTVDRGYIHVAGLTHVFGNVRSRAAYNEGVRHAYYWFKKHARRTDEYNNGNLMDLGYHVRYCSGKPSEVYICYASLDRSQGHIRRF